MCSQSHSCLAQLKAARLIREADVILYDDLGTQVRLLCGTCLPAQPWSVQPKGLLAMHAQAAVEEFAAPGAETTYVGKRGAAKAFPQADIDRMLVDYCLLV